MDMVMETEAGGGRVTADAGGGSATVGTEGRDGVAANGQGDGGRGASDAAQRDGPHSAGAVDEVEVEVTEGGVPIMDPPCYVLLHSLSKKHNGTAVIRSSVGLGVRCIVMAGSDKFTTFGCHGSDAYMDFKHFAKLETAVEWLKVEKKCEIVGIEICDGAKPLATAPFKGPTAFLVGNEGHGLTPEEMALCDWFVYIPQHGFGTASLNVAVATSIVLYSFAQWAQYPEAPREGYKYVLHERKNRTSTKGQVALHTPAEKAAGRAAARAAAAAEAEVAFDTDLFQA